MRNSEGKAEARGDPVVTLMTQEPAFLIDHVCAFVANLYFGRCRIFNEQVVSEGNTSPGTLLCT